MAEKRAKALQQIWGNQIRWSQSSSEHTSFRPTWCCAALGWTISLICKHEPLNFRMINLQFYLMIFNCLINATCMTIWPLTTIYSSRCDLILWINGLTISSCACINMTQNTTHLNCAFIKDDPIWNSEHCNYLHRSLRPFRWLEILICH